MGPQHATALSRSGAEQRSSTGVGGGASGWAGLALQDCGRARQQRESSKQREGGPALQGGVERAQGAGRAAGRPGWAACRAGGRPSHQPADWGAAWRDLGRTRLSAAQRVGRATTRPSDAAALQGRPPGVKLGAARRGAARRGAAWRGRRSRRGPLAAAVTD